MGTVGTAAEVALVSRFEAASIALSAVIRHDSIEAILPFQMYDRNPAIRYQWTLFGDRIRGQEWTVCGDVEREEDVKKTFVDAKTTIRILREIRYTIGKD